MGIDLRPLGWDAARAAAYAPLRRGDLRPARVAEVTDGVCTVLAASGVARASVGGGLLGRAAADPLALPCVGDWVAVRAWPDARSTVEAVLTRRTHLVWAAPGRARRRLRRVANIDAVAAVEPCRPRPDLGRIARLRDLAATAGVRFLVVVTTAGPGAAGSGAAGSGTAGSGTAGSGRGAATSGPGGSRRGAGWSGSGGPGIRGTGALAAAAGRSWPDPWSDPAAWIGPPAWWSPGAWPDPPAWSRGLAAWPTGPPAWPALPGARPGALPGGPDEMAALVRAALPGVLVLPFPGPVTGPVTAAAGEAPPGGGDAFPGARQRAPGAGEASAGAGERASGAGERLPGAAAPSPVDSLGGLVGPGHTLALLGAPDAATSAVIAALAGTSVLRSSRPAGAGQVLIPLPGGGAVIDVPGVPAW